MKIQPALWALVLLLSACQLPVTAPTATTTVAAAQAGTASLNVVLKTNGFTFVPMAASQTGRFIISPAPTPGVAYYVLQDLSANAGPPIVGDSVTTPVLNGIPPGPYSLQVTLKNGAGTTQGTTTLSSVTLYAGPNAVPVTVAATQTGTSMGRIDVAYDWSATGRVATPSFDLEKITLTNNSGVYTATETQVSPLVAGVDWVLGSNTVHFAKDVPSGSYRLTLQLQNGGANHPPITATAEVYDGVVSTINVALTSAQLNGPPTTPLTPTLDLSPLGYPRLNWSLVPTTAAGYQLARDGAAIGAPISALASSTVDTLAYLPGSNLLYSIAAVNDFGASAPSATVAFQSASSVTLGAAAFTGFEAGGIYPGPYLPTLSPANASFPSVTWSSSNPVVATVLPSGNLRALGIGTTTVTAKSVEANGPSDSATVTVAASVATVVTGVTGLNAMTMGPDGSLYYVYQGSTVHQRAADGTVTDLGGGTYSAPAGIAVDAAGNVYVADGNAIYKETPGTPYTQSLLAGVWASTGATDGNSALFNAPRGLAVDPATGNLFVADSHNYKIRIINPVGTTASYTGTTNIPSVSGEYDGSLASALFSMPTGLAFDADRNLYVSDLNGGVIRKIDFGTQMVSTIAGDGYLGQVLDGPAASARFASPWGLAFDGNDLYVGDTNFVVRRLRFAGPAGPAMVTTLAGNPAVDSGGTPTDTDGQGSVALFSTVRGVAAGGGVIYASDTNTTGTNAIRKIQTSIYESITPTDPEFSDLTTLGYSSVAPLYTGDGQNGTLRIGTILLYTTSSGNHGKMLITGIDPDFDSPGSGYWRLHLDWTTWDSNGNVVSWVTNRDYGSNEISHKYLDLDASAFAAGLVSTSITGDMFLTGTQGTSGGAYSRQLTPASFGLAAGVYH